MSAFSPVLVRAAPWVERHGLLQVRAVPFSSGAGRRGEQCGKSLFGSRVAADVEPVGVERLLEGLHLGPGDRDLGFTQLGEVLRTNVGRQQANDDDDHQQFQQREAVRHTTKFQCSSHATL
jgi:hypothetical protein